MYFHPTVPQPPPNNMIVANLSVMPIWLVPVTTFSLWRFPWYHSNRSGVLVGREMNTSQAKRTQLARPRLLPPKNLSDSRNHIL